MRFGRLGEFRGEGGAACGRVLLTAGLVAVSAVVTTACVVHGDRSEIRPDANANESGSQPPSRADSVFRPIQGYRFELVPRELEHRLTSRFLDVFQRLRPVSVAARSVVREGGALVPIRVVAVSYRLPKDVPFSALASEVGREFLGITPRNAREVMNGRGTYVQDTDGARLTETVSFFIGREIFVYMFGIGREAPTEEIARKLLRANS